jgi:hypothetical protein
VTTIKVTTIKVTTIKVTTIMIMTMKKFIVIPLKMLTVIMLEAEEQDDLKE